MPTGDLFASSELFDFCEAEAPPAPDKSQSSRIARNNDDDSVEVIDFEVIDETDDAEEESDVEVLLDGHRKESAKGDSTDKIDVVGVSPSKMDVDSEKNSADLGDGGQDNDGVNDAISESGAGDDVMDFTPVISVKFRNSDVTRKYKSRVEAFLSEMVGRDPPRCARKSNDAELDDVNLELNIYEGFSIDSGGGSTIVEDHSSDRAGRHRQMSSSQKKTADENGSYAIPRYAQDFSDALTLESPKEKPAAASSAGSPLVSVATCFNCLGKHMVSECKLARNPRTIARNRREFSQNNHSNRSCRYHEDVDQKYENIKPGKLSEELREALGLRNHELPSYIYKMRVLGYPPGWLEEAKVQGSGLSLFNVSGQDAEMETNDRSYSKKAEYDINKLVKYPGYNAELPPGVRDEYRRYGYTAMRSSDSLERFAKALGAKEFTYRNRKRRMNRQRTKDEGEKVKQAKESDDKKATESMSEGELESSGDEEVMIIHDSRDPEKAPKTIADQSPEEKDLLTEEEKANISDDSAKPQESPEIDLAEVKRINEKELVVTDEWPPREEECEESQEPPAIEQKEDPSDDHSDAKDTEKNETVDSTEAVESTDPSPAVEENSVNTTDNNVQAECSKTDTMPAPNTNASPAPTPASMVSTPSTAGQSKSRSLGTPIVSHSPYTSLPNYSNFTKDVVGDWILFGNLPDSTGKFDKMNMLLKKVRRKLDEYGSDDEIID